MLDTPNRNSIRLFKEVAAQQVPTSNPGCRIQAQEAMGSLFLLRRGHQVHINSLHEQRVRISNKRLFLHKDTLPKQAIQHHKAMVLHRKHILLICNNHTRRRSRSRRQHQLTHNPKEGDHTTR